MAPTPFEGVASDQRFAVSRARRASIDAAAESQLGAKMTQPARIAEILYEDSFATPAAILVALIDNPSMAVLPADRHHMLALRRRGCIGLSGPTALGRRVGLVLRNVHGLEARCSLREAGAHLSQVLLDCESPLASQWTPGAAKH
jgi:hypothetical protein